MKTIKHAGLIATENIHLNGGYSVVTYDGYLYLLTEGVEKVEMEEIAKDDLKRLRKQQIAIVKEIQKLDKELTKLSLRRQQDRITAQRARKEAA